MLLPKFEVIYISLSNLSEILINEEWRVRGGLRRKYNLIECLRPDRRPIVRCLRTAFGIGDGVEPEDI